MPDLEMCPHCSIALVDCEYHGPKAKRAERLDAGDFQIEVAGVKIRGVQDKERFVGELLEEAAYADGEFFSAPAAPSSFLEAVSAYANVPPTQTVAEVAAQIQANVQRAIDDILKADPRVPWDKPSEWRPEHVEPMSGDRYRWANDEHMTVLNPTACSCGAEFVIGFAVGPNDSDELRWRCMGCQPR